MSIKDFEQRKLREQAVNRVFDEASRLLIQLHAFSSHANSCHSREDDDETCTCGYHQLLQEIERFRSQ